MSPTLPEGILPARLWQQGLITEILIKLDFQIVAHIPRRGKTGRFYIFHAPMDREIKHQRALIFKKF